MLLIVALAGCATEPKISRPPVALPAQFTPANPSPMSAAAPAASIIGDWWTLYGDTSLNEIVSAALKNNTDLALAVARIDETAAVPGLTRSAQWPSVDLGGVGHALAPEHLEWAAGSPGWCGIDDAPGRAGDLIRDRPVGQTAQRQRRGATADARGGVRA